MIKAVIFDCYGVIAVNPVALTMRQFGREHNHEDPDLREVFSKYDHGIISRAEMHGELAERVGVSREEWRKASENNSGLDTELLEYIKNLPTKTAILSNIGPESFNRVMHATDLSFLDGVFLSGEIGMVKPGVEIFEYAARELGVEPNECIFVDDMQSNVDGANAAGMLGILFKDFDDIKNELKVLLP